MVNDPQTGERDWVNLSKDREMKCTKRRADCFVHSALLIPL
ncbi:hypothetical protein HMPREF0973_01632 [Prevotella veroralis F0319]|uniref:Uncharacterized protein n=1 Tax=Prevotella veroralis F0319 TaxID=649761 RepID=C9MPU1_9BACT|nr:hypothetical protein HMPREF0973_01632 [Prevotella veroralis F0319]